MDEWSELFKIQFNNSTYSTLLELKFVETAYKL